MSEPLFLLRNAAVSRMNALGDASCPFLFIIDFLQQNSIVLPIDEINDGEILYQTPISSNSVAACVESGNISIDANPVSQSKYAVKFDKVVKEIRLGNSFVTNLTCETPVVCNASLKEIYLSAKARYKLLLSDRFVCFSPETFVRIEDGEIVTNPMKGTINAAVPNAEALILNDEKEKAEHNCIVDLLRNDLSRVAHDVRVTHYRYIDRIATERGELLQVSSEIRGKLASDYRQQLGDIIFSMLPAGSVTGAPKIKTTEIILHVEGYERGFYTGIFGLFDGRSLDSAVMIRFIEKTPAGLVYKSGGGITARSHMEDEYLEMIAKIYVPVG